MFTVVPHKVVAGSTRHGPFVEPDCNPVPVPSPLEPITVVNVAVDPGKTDLVSGAALGAVGGSTRGVIVEFT
jgi:hypothetical protein